MKTEFEKFVKNDLGLEIWSGNKVIFFSKKESVRGLLEFIEKYGKQYKDLIIFDKKVGNAVALLCAYLDAKEIYGKVGSELAAKTLKEFNIKYYFSKTIPNILNKDETDLCPMEKMSSSKTPESFLDDIQAFFCEIADRQQR